MQNESSKSANKIYFKFRDQNLLKLFAVYLKIYTKMGSHNSALV